MPRPFSTPDRFRIFWRLLETGATVELDGLHVALDLTAPEPRLCQVLYRSTPDGVEERLVRLDWPFQAVLDALIAVPQSTIVTWAAQSALRRRMRPR